jgi:putative iron-dependent peroxidase
MILAVDARSLTPDSSVTFGRMTKTTPQPGILCDAPRLARYLLFQLAPEGVERSALDALRELPASGKCVVGIGAMTVKALAAELPALRELQPYVGPGFSMPVTPGALFLWLHGDDRGDLVHATRELTLAVEPHFELTQVIDAFQYRDSRDLTGYVDGTENPTGDKAVAAGIADDGSSYVAVQQWVHDLEAFDALSEEERDQTIGRRISNNEEIEDAPESAHVKRTAQEDFDPEAFILRRSMPWADEAREGLVFVAFGHSLDAFEQLQRRMAGLDDGIADALFRFTKPETGATFWCPPMKNGELDLSAIGL